MIPCSIDACTTGDWHGAANQRVERGIGDAEESAPPVAKVGVPGLEPAVGELPKWSIKLFISISM